MYAVLGDLSREGEVHAFGYGAAGSDCFPLNIGGEGTAKEKLPGPRTFVMSSVEDVLKGYEQACMHVQPSARGKKYSLKEILLRFLGSAKQDSLQYNVLVLMTHGGTYDNDTVEAIVEASYLPITILVLGLSTNPESEYSHFIKLDRWRRSPLVAPSGTPHQRNNVHFGIIPEASSMDVKIQEAAKLASHIADDMEHYYSLCAPPDLL
eukprot:gene4587-5620_t